MGNRTLKFRNRLLLSFLSVFLPLILAGSLLIYHQIQTHLENQIERELQGNADALTNLIQTTANIAIKNSLQAIALQNLEIAEYFYSKYRSGVISKEEALAIIEEAFLSQDIGISGYIYCLNSSGEVLIHPNDRVKGTNVSQHGFIQKQLQLKEGYLEYEWMNPGETQKRPKALYMAYYKPLDWIISVSSYRNEFNHLVDVRELEESVKGFRSGDSGYAFVMDRDGTALIHPILKGKNLLNRSNEFDQIVHKALTVRSGMLRYKWQNPNDPFPREKIVIFRYLPEFEWLIGSTSYTEEVFSPLTTYSIWIAAGLLAFLLVFTGITYLISKSVTRPLEHMAETLEAGTKGDYSVRMPEERTSELSALSSHFNAFMDRLEDYHGKLNQEIQKTVDTQAALVENELKLRGLFNQSFQYTCILSPYGILEEVNKSALEFAGCTEADVLYKPYWETPWWQHDRAAQEQIKDAIQKALSGQLVRLETTHRTGQGDLREIDISVKPILNNSNRVEFIVTEGRDITELKEADRKSVV